MEPEIPQEIEHGFPEEGKEISGIGSPRATPPGIRKISLKSGCSAS